ncbi:MAG: flagellar assembly peptidoglycan hydrolase FlgJ [Shewanella sp.]|nr:flagellar assembly peptidoglycan hydrolase FlgJ [Shewanella sp.]MCF1429774.1 flagellar assembly peptidoglycan hydrolase FlgJ [Shewanella sp.]MCF1457033.1 flagellar assembly peptidoglycan hydrolase FlgJ [Shewanella sp.]
MDKLANSAQYLDLAALDNLRARAQQDDKAALKEVAAQFEGIFVQMLMQSMRDANEAFRADSPFNTQYTQFYEQMRDQQMSVELGAQGTLGLVDLMVQQLAPETSNIMPASGLRGNRQHFDKAHSVSSAVSAAINSEPSEGGKLLPPHQALPVVADFSSPQEFVERLFPLADKAARQLGTEPEVLLAQAALETGWGQKMVRCADGSPSNNLFNIKADNRWEGDKARVSTLEFEQGVAARQQADFRVYDSLASSFEDFVEFIRSSDRYSEARAVARDPAAFMQGLQQAGYATDPGYADKVMRVMGKVVEWLAPGVVGLNNRAGE